MREICMSGSMSEMLETGNDALTTKGTARRKGRKQLMLNLQPLRHISTLPVKSY